MLRLELSFVKLVFCCKAEDSAYVFITSTVHGNRFMLTWALLGRISLARRCSCLSCCRVDLYVACIYVILACFTVFYHVFC